MSEPRKFWIEILDDCDDIVWDHNPNESNAIHVIEYSAYEDRIAAMSELESDYDALDKYAVDLRKEYDNLEAKCAKLVNAIKRRMASDDACELPFDEDLGDALNEIES